MSIEGFGNEVSPNGQVVLSGFTVPRADNDEGRRPTLSDVTRQRKAVHGTRHLNIREDNRYVRILLEYFDSLHRAARFARPIARLP